MTSEKEKNDEWQNRLRSYRNFCSGRNKLLSTRSQRFFLTGKSEGNVHFSTCLVAKAASTSLSLAFLLGSGFVKDPSKAAVKRLTDGDQRFTPACNRESNGCLIKGGTSVNKKGISVIFGRDPMARIVSAWKDKIYRNSAYYYSRYTKEILRSQGFTNPPLSGALANERNIHANFENFAKWLTQGSNHLKDEHWTPANQICSVCAFDLDFIGHIEHFEDDIMEFYRQTKVERSYSDLSLGLDAVNGHATKNDGKTLSLEDHFMNIDTDIRKQLLNRYKDDYAAFGYPIPDFLKF